MVKETCVFFIVETMLCQTLFPHVPVAMVNRFSVYKLPDTAFKRPETHVALGSLAIQHTCSSDLGQPLRTG